ncbi:acyltransferase [Pseudomonas capeferrum]|uniref:acyltransferase family protein n=1 Tax=Pseudomonas capeferrum TaxID=1495066 RepID=UPI0015E2F053|nr:acyltransferase [Pseudomonas capeferrum]MBA1204473.1 acyltransferase [Pseudomonas capeferrum]
MEKYYGIQYLRGLAALFVIVYHSLVMAAVAPYFQNPVGDFGVDIFFVISGFVMWITTDNKRKGTLHFWWARVLRVAPLYWFFTLLIISAALILPSLFFNSRGIDPVFILKSLLFIPAQNPDVGDVTPVYTIGWTLIYEMFFYFLFGFGLLIDDMRKRFTFIVMLFSGLALCGMLVNFKDPVLATYTGPLILEFLAGVVLGYFRRHLLNLGPKVGAGLVMAALTTLMLVHADQSSRFWIYGIPSLALVSGVVVLEKYIQGTVKKIPLFLGEVSYSLYLSHPISQRVWYVVFIMLFGQIASKEVAITYALGSVVVGVLGGVICYLVVEKQLLRLARMGTRRKQNATRVISH